MPTKDRAHEPATTRAIDLLRAPLAARVMPGGYVDVLPAAGARPHSLAQRAMHLGPLPAIYEAAWRPLLFTAWTGRTTGDEERLMLEGLEPQAGQIALDIACGPGNTTRRLADAVAADGLVLGVDVATGMLRRAVADTRARHVAYVRADAEQLPFLDRTVDRVSCFGALYLIEDPWAAMAEMVRVLRPGGRIALLTTCGRGPGIARAVVRHANQISGVRIFEPDAIVEHLRALGVIRIEQHVRSISQLVIGELPPA